MNTYQKRAEILDILLLLNYDELCVIFEAAQGLKLGQTNYGQLNLDKDQRNWLTEMEAELRDMINYAGMKLTNLKRLKQREALDSLTNNGVGDLPRQTEDSSQLGLFEYTPKKE